MAITEKSKTYHEKMFPGYECCGKNRFLTRE